MSKVKETYPVIGLECASCVNKMDKILSKTDGIINANINLASEKATIEYENEKIGIDKIENIVKNAGYELIT